MEITAYNHRNKIVGFCFHFGLIAAALPVLAPAVSHAGNAARAVPVARLDPRSKLEVRTIVVAPAPRRSGNSIALAPRNPNVKDMVEEAAQRYDVSPALIDSVIQVESNYNPLAVSPKGAQGLMQLMPGTARRFGVAEPFDARENIQGGARYLKFLQDTFKDDRLAIAAYNAGEGAVAKYKDVPPYPETVNYVAKVGKRLGKANQARERKTDGKQAEASAAATPQMPPEPRYNALRQYTDNEGRLHLTTE